jgi:L-iditol 2-dehydrogenase
MRQAIMTAPGKIELRSVSKPTAGAGEVVLRIRRIGVCGSDIHVYHGLHPYTSYPVVQGHEVSATIEAVGSGVAGFTVGQAVTFMPQLTCGTCRPCRDGLYNVCDSLRVMGFQAPGAAQDYFAVAASKLIPFPAGLSADAGALIEPLAVACHAIRRGGGVAGKKVAVIGAGPIGNLMTQTAVALGAREVLISDTSDFRLSLAGECGASHTTNPRDRSFAEAVADAFGPDRADLILECVGAEPTMTEAIASARKGTTIVVVGVFGKKPVVDLGLVQDRELSLVGTLMYRKEDYDQAVALAGSGKMKLEKLITDRFPLERYLDAYQYIEKAGDKAMKVVIDLDQE